jgi:hypothetical protein
MSETIHFESLTVRTPQTFRRGLTAAFQAGSVFAEACRDLRIADRQRQRAADIWSELLDA